VRIGTAEIYAVLASVPEIDDALVVSLARPDGGFIMPLFVRLAGDQVLGDRLREEIRGRLRKEYTPRHVPDAIIQVPDIPVTLTGKKMEVPVRRILSGIPPGLAANRNAMANPASLDAFAAYARTQPGAPPAELKPHYRQSFGSPVPKSLPVVEAGVRRRAAGRARAARPVRNGEARVTEPQLA
jgi:acetoacetyl-CoA synthetase